MTFIHDVLLYHMCLYGLDKWDQCAFVVLIHDDLLYVPTVLGWSWSLKINVYLWSWFIMTCTNCRFLNGLNYWRPGLPCVHVLIFEDQCECMVLTIPDYWAWVLQNSKDQCACVVFIIQDQLYAWSWLSKVSVLAWSCLSMISVHSLSWLSKVIFLRGLDYSRSEWMCGLPLRSMCMRGPDDPRSVSIHDLNCQRSVSKAANQPSLIDFDYPEGRVQQGEAGLSHGHWRGSSQHLRLHRQLIPFHSFLLNTPLQYFFDLFHNIPTANNHRSFCISVQYTNISVLTNSLKKTLTGPELTEPFSLKRWIINLKKLGMCIVAY